MKKYLLLAFSLGLMFLFAACSSDTDEQDTASYAGEGVENSPAKDADIQRYNLQQKMDLAANRTPCDTLALMEYVLDNFPEGTYLVDFDRTFTYSIPKPAVLYYNQTGSQGGTYVFGVIARSRPGERLIESKNVVGYDQSFIDLDSTRLGTAFFYLTLFECTGGSFSTVWEAPIPSHGGFNTVSLQRWDYKGTPYIRVNFHYAQGIGHIDYNYFLIDGLTAFPHLLMTYKGINFQRTLTNVNNDKFPDYLEYLYYDLGDRVFAKDSIPFIWEPKDSVYVNTRNKRQTRPY